MKIDAQTEQSYRHEMLCGDRRNVPGMVRASLGVYSTEDVIGGYLASDVLCHRSGF